jgi:hypothetical protein
MEELLLKVINGEVESVEVPFQKLSYYYDILTSLGCEESGYDSNGYQVDFSLYFDKDSKLFSIEGSLWYSDNLTFSIVKND